MGGRRLEIVEYREKWIGAAVYRSPSQSFLEDPEPLIREAQRMGVSLSLFAADPVISLRQIIAAAISSLAAFRSGSNVARNLGIEVLLRISCDTQIDRALKTIGVNKDTKEVGICIISNSRDDLVRIEELASHIIDGVEVGEEELASPERIERAVRFYDISDRELASIQAKNPREAVLSLVFERIATLDIWR